MYFLCIDILNNTHNVTHKNLTIGSINRLLDSRTRNIFNQDLDLIMKRMQNENKHIIICCDANVNLLSVENNMQSSDYLGIFMANGFIPKITKPTRVTIN